MPPQRCRPDSTEIAVDPVDAAYWMRIYFRHARSIERALKRGIEDLPARKQSQKNYAEAPRAAESFGEFRIERGQLILRSAVALGSRAEDPAHNPEVVLEVFAAMARSGCTLGRETEERLSHALGLISASLEEGPALWSRLQGYSRRALCRPRSSRHACAGNSRTTGS